MAYSPTERNDIQDEIRADAEQRTAKALAEFRTLLQWVLLSCRDISEAAELDEESVDWLIACRRLSDEAVRAKAALPDEESDEPVICRSCNGTGESGINRGPGYSCPCGACKGKGVTE
jgi:hypothetical protein